MSPPRRLFLGVERSANGIAWTHRLDERQDRAALAIAQTWGLPDIVARVLASRDVPVADAAAYLDPTIRDLLPDPRSFTDMDRVAGRLVQAILRREPVAVFGDYDVDGAASSALLVRFLRHYGVLCEVYIPDRIFEGYGPNPNAMRELAARGARLIVTVDCGTNSAEAIGAARDRGVDVVVIDHHQQGGSLPDAPVVNPNRIDDLSGQGHLCAAGLVFVVLVELARLLREAGMGEDPPRLLALLDLVALATVCDVVPLTGVNRAYVAKGLAAVRRQENPGIAALMRVSRIGESVKAHHLGFMLGPRINAGGRIGDAALGSRLLATDDPGEAAVIAETLDRLNAERQAMEQAMLDEARAEADAELARGQGPAVLVTARDGWHPGIAGILASRLKDHARRPSFAIAFDVNGNGTGSGRSVAGFDLGLLVREAVGAGLLVKGGGHAMAAGITLKREMLGPLRAFFEDRATAIVSRLRAEETLRIDAALSAEGATPDLLDQIEQAGPFGSGAPAPVFALPRHRLVDVRPAGIAHIRVLARSEAGGTLSAIAFRALDTPLGEFLTLNRDRTVHLAGTLQADTWQGRRGVQVRLIDAAQTNTV